MTEKEVKIYIKEENWVAFCKWMYGQTVGSNKDGSIDYYECDVRSFKEKLDTGYDRQANSLEWD